MSEDTDFIGEFESEDYDFEVNAEAASLRSNERIREQMANDVAAFLAQGGKIKEVEQGFQADPPRKPESKYGSQPI